MKSSASEPLLKDQNEKKQEQEQEQIYKKIRQASLRSWYNNRSAPVLRRGRGHPFVRNERIL